MRRLNDIGSASDFLISLFIIIVLVVMSWSFYLSPKDSSGTLEGEDSFNDGIESLERFNESLRPPTPEDVEMDKWYEYIPIVNVIVGFFSNVADALSWLWNLIGSVLNVLFSLFRMAFDVLTFNFSFLQGVQFLLLRLVLIVFIYASIIVTVLSVIAGG